MESVRIVDLKDVSLTSPIFIEGLPGIGNVGKLAAQHLVDSLEMTAVCDIYCTDFPPQVTIQDDGTVRLVGAHMFAKPKALGGRDVIVLTGDYQPMTSPGQYDLVSTVLDRLDRYGCREMYTLGGYGVPEATDEPAVFGAATDTKLMALLKANGVDVPPDDAGGGIIGASGLFLGLGMLRKMAGACLMGETAGFMVDPNAARAVLKVVGSLLKTEIDVGELDDKAREVDRLTQQLHEGELQAATPEGDLHYIG